MMPGQDGNHTGILMQDGDHSGGPQAFAPHSWGFDDTGLQKKRRKANRDLRRRNNLLTLLRWRQPEGQTLGPRVSAAASQLLQRQYGLQAQEDRTAAASRELPPAQPPLRKPLVAADDEGTAYVPPAIRRWEAVQHNMRERGAKDEAAHSRYRAETEQRLRELDERTKQKRGAGMERLGNKRLSLNRTELQSSNRKMDVGKFIMDGPFQRRCVSELDWYGRNRAP